MYIPLDYYRILGLPIQSTSDQLRQAHRDRTLQLPRREYSDTAIASRKQLLDEAYGVLSDPERRRAYDASFLAKTYELAPGLDAAAVRNGDSPVLQPTGEMSVDVHTPSIEIQDNQLVGALLILQELGEYELVLKLGRPFLTGGKMSLKNGQYGDPTIVFPDIVLTVALACLELGREQWQQGQYENAAEALDTGQQLLLREGLFVGVRGEIQSDLYKLRPYRVLELVALPEEQTADRLKGLQLLQEMLGDRGGIDGNGVDHSGLNIDDFLRFIQQLRGYLTAAEQQVLFEEEARRPSAVATYLAVYALLARGFADRQPALIQRAKQLLQRLSARQDVHLEQAVCTLLLGQTEEASQALELSQEYGPIAFIREHSQGSPDLLPGLCLYSEHWLQNEVFPHFRDLLQRQAALKDYFADYQVQAYLENLPSEATVVDEWSFEQPAASPSRSRPNRAAIAKTATQEPMTATRVSRTPAAAAAPVDTQSTDALVEAARARIAARIGGTAVAERVPAGLAAMPAAERVGVPGNEGSVGRDRTRPTGGEGSGGNGRGRTRRGTANSESAAGQSTRRSKTWWRWLLPGLALFGIVTMGFALARLWVVMQSPQKQTAQVQPSPMQPSIATTPGSTASSPSPTDNPAVLDTATAKKAVESWLAAKSAAMGPDYDATKLEQVLADPKLTEWRNASQEAKRDNWYKQYKHTIKISSVEPDSAQSVLSKPEAVSSDPTKSDPAKSDPAKSDLSKPEAVNSAPAKPDSAKSAQATIVADVSEVTSYYVAGTLKDTSTDNLRVQYSLIQQEDGWRIQDWRILQ